MTFSVDFQYQTASPSVKPFGRRRLCRDIGSSFTFTMNARRASSVCYFCLFHSFQHKFQVSPPGSFSSVAVPSLHVVEFEFGVFDNSKLISCRVESFDSGLCEYLPYHKIRTYAFTSIPPHTTNSTAHSHHCVLDKY